jgi:hypothetical protein
MSKHRKASGHKPPGEKKAKANGKRELSTKDLKEKTVAAEMGGTVLREEAPKPLAAPGSMPDRAAMAKEPAPKPKAREKAPIDTEKATELPPYLVETAVDAFERWVKAAGEGTLAVNRALIGFARANMASGFDLARSLATAGSPMHIVALQETYWDQRVKAFARQADELRALSADLIAKANEPIREHLRRAKRAAA